MQTIPAWKNTSSPRGTNSTATDSSEPSKTPAGEATATTPGDGDTSHMPGDADDASSTPQSMDALTPKAPTSRRASTAANPATTTTPVSSIGQSTVATPSTSTPSTIPGEITQVPTSPQASTDPGQISNVNNGSKGTSTGTGVLPFNAQGVAVAASSPNPATTSVGQSTVAASSPSTTSTTPGVITQAPSIAASTPQTAKTWTPWSLLSGIFPNRLTTTPATTLPVTTLPATTPPTTQAPIVNNPIMQTLSLPSSIAVAPPVTTGGGNQLQQYPNTATSAQKAKRKRHQAPALNIMRRKRVRPTIIDDRVALSVLKELRMTRTFLEQGRILAWALQPDDTDFINIYDYVSRGQAHEYGIKILSIIRIIPNANALQNDDSPPVSFSEDPNAVGKLRKMLWHGTKQRVVGSILDNGLRLPTGRGQMFGSGIYFADRISKSAGYCDNRFSHQGVAYLLLCDVLLGEVYESTSAMPSLKKAPQHHVPGRGMVDCDSVQGCGKKVPDEGWNMTIDGCIWPLGPTVQRSGFRGFSFSSLLLNYNEFIVYDTKQVQPKYLVKVERVHNPVHESVY